MKFNYLLVGLLFFSIGKGWGCDVCNIYEFGTTETKNYVGVFYRYNTFQGYKYYPQSSFGSQLGNSPVLFRTKDNEPFILHDPEDNGQVVAKSSKDREIYSTIELRANFFIKEKYNLLIILPYRQNEIYYKRLYPSRNGILMPARDSVMSTQGLGDVMLGFDRAFRIENKKDWVFVLRPGIAVQLPTGQFNVAAPQGELYDPIIQPGTSAMGAIARFNANIMRNNLGANFSANYRWMTEGTNKYQFGNGLNLMLNLFYQFEAGNVFLIPKFGGYFESATNDSFHGSEQLNSGGNALFSNLGIAANWNKFTLSFMGQFPVKQNLNGNQILHKDRLIASLLRNF